jgi:hypothetical protein
MSISVLLGLTALLWLGIWWDIRRCRERRERFNAEECLRDFNFRRRHEIAETERLVERHWALNRLRWELNERKAQRVRNQLAYLRGLEYRLALHRGQVQDHLTPEYRAWVEQNPPSCEARNLREPGEDTDKAS